MIAWGASTKQVVINYVSSEKFERVEVENVLDCIASPLLGDFFIQIIIFVLQ